MDENAKSPNYFIDSELANNLRRNMSLLMASRKCYADRQADTEEYVINSDPQEHLDRITEHCKDTQDYLLPDTPIKDAIFRVLLSTGNRPMTAEEISADLSSRWLTSNYPRDLSPKVIAQVLKNDQFYCITELRSDETVDEAKE